MKRVHAELLIHLSSAVSSHIGYDKFETECRVDSSCCSCSGWTLGSSAGENIFVHEFSINGGGAWTKFTTADSYQTLATGIGVSSPQNFDLRITAPNPSSDAIQKSITITIQAVQPP